MKKLFNLKSRNQKGQALPIVLCLLAIGGMTIGASLNYNTNVLNGGRVIKQNLDGNYAADAGIQYNIWALQNGNVTLSQLPELINGMTVNMSTVYNPDDDEITTVYINGLASGEHADGYHMSFNLTPAGNNTYNVTITLVTTNDAKNNAKLQELGAVLPMGYTYVNNSANVNPSGNITPNNPSTTGYDGQGHQWLKWLWSGSSMPSLPRNQTWTEKYAVLYRSPPRTGAEPEKVKCVYYPWR